MYRTSLWNNVMKLYCPPNLIDIFSSVVFLVVPPAIKNEANKVSFDSLDYSRRSLSSFFSAVARESGGKDEPSMKTPLHWRCGSLKAGWGMQARDRDANNMLIQHQVQKEPASPFKSKPRDRDENLIRKKSDKNVFCDGKIWDLICKSGTTYWR